MKINLIYAQSQNSFIGLNGTIPWNLPEDLQHFKRHTLNHPVIMGRKTWESLPNFVRPLPLRPNIVISKQQNYVAAGASIFTSINDAVCHCAQLPCGPQEAWCIGGTSIYEIAMPLASKIIRTTVSCVIDGDTLAPSINDDWRLIKFNHHISSNGQKYLIEEFIRH